MDLKINSVHCEKFKLIDTNLAVTSIKAIHNFVGFHSKLLKKTIYKWLGRWKIIAVIYIVITTLFFQFSIALMIYYENTGEKKTHFIIWFGM